MSETKTTAAAAAKAQEDPRKILTLEQKFVELRKAVPAIVQKQHSDGVKYKFAKIFDVYELLAPAMNTFGVNFDVVAETATNHKENGDPLYYSSFQQQTRNGPRTVWVYEADITIRWTNADNPDEKQEVTLHALGTNDGGPDKAKGSAWTYCLKYYKVRTPRTTTTTETSPEQPRQGLKQPHRRTEGRRVEEIPARSSRRLKTALRAHRAANRPEYSPTPRSTASTRRRTPPA